MSTPIDIYLAHTKKLVEILPNIPGGDPRYLVRKNPPLPPLFWHLNCMVNRPRLWPDRGRLCQVYGTLHDHKPHMRKLNAVNIVARVARM